MLQECEQSSDKKNLSAQVPYQDKLGFTELFNPFFDFRFPSLALQRETIVKKIMQLKLPKTKNKVAKICNDPGIRDFTNLNVT